MDIIDDRFLELGENACDLLSRGLHPVVELGQEIAESLHAAANSAGDLPDEAFDHLSPSFDGSRPLSAQETAAYGHALGWIVSGMVFPLAVVRNTAVLAAWSLAVSRKSL